MKLKWHVAEAPTGQYRSFSKRGWPTATFIGPNGQEELAFFLSCVSEYVPKNVKIGHHEPIKIIVLDRRENEKSWSQRAFTSRASTLAEAKERCQKFFDDHPEYFVNKA